MPAARTIILHRRIHLKKQTSQSKTRATPASEARNRYRLSPWLRSYRCVKSVRRQPTWRRRLTLTKVRLIGGWSRARNFSMPAASVRRLLMSVWSNHQRAVGYSYEAEKVVRHNGKMVIVKYHVNVEGNVSAQRFWLMNRRPDRWRLPCKIEPPRSEDSITEKLVRHFADTGKRPKE